MSEKTKIIFCTCKHDYQDEKYGEQKRIHNFVEKISGWRCTVCENVKSK